MPPISADDPRQVALGASVYAARCASSDMPAFAGVLRDGEIAAALAYIKSRWPADVRARRARTSEQWNDKGLTP